MENKATKIRYIMVSIIVVADLILLPWLLKFPSFLVSDLATAPSNWFQYGMLKSIKEIFIDPQFLKLYLFMQIPVGALIISIAWDVHKFKKKNRIGDGVGGPEPAGAGQHGTSRWQNMKEMDENATVWYTDEPVKRGGTIFGIEKSKKGEKVWFNSKDIHILLVALTRFGKGRRIFLPSIWSLAKSGESIVATDPKGELYIITKDYLLSQGYDVVVLNFREPGRGNQWNLIESVNRAVDEGNITKATEIAWDIANTIASRKVSGGSDPVWENGEKSVIVTLILIISINSEFKFQRHMKSVYRLLAKYGRVLEDDSVPLLDYILQLPDDHPAKDAFATADLAPYKMRGSFFSMVLADLQLFSDPNIGEMTSKTDHNFRDIGIKKTAVFLIIPDDKPARNVLATIYIDQLYQNLVELANEEGGRIPNRTNFLLDEFGNLPPIPDMDTKITVAGGRGMRFTLAVQSLTQVKSKYKDGADTITGNCAIWLFFGTNDSATRKTLSEMTGKYTVETENTSSSIQNKGHSTTAGVGLTGRALLTDDEIGRWDNNETLVFNVGKFPARYPILDLSLWGANSDYGLTPPSKDIAKDELDNLAILKERWNKVPRRKQENVSVWLPDFVYVEENNEEEIEDEINTPQFEVSATTDNQSENQDMEDLRPINIEDFLENIIGQEVPSEEEEEDFL